MRTNSLVAALVCLSFVVACGNKGNPAAPPPPTTPPPPLPAVTLQSVSLAAPLSSLDRAGATAQVTATGTFSNGTTQNVTASCTDWASDNRSVLTVNQSGLMTAVGNGSATVTTDCQGKQGRGLVTLNLIPAQLWTYSGKGNTVFAMPTYVKRIRVRGVWDGRSNSNLIIFVGNHLVVNEILRDAPGRAYEGIHNVTAGDVEIQNSTNVAWTLTEVR